MAGKIKTAEVYSLLKTLDYHVYCKKKAESLLTLPLVYDVI